MTTLTSRQPASWRGCAVGFVPRRALGHDAVRLDLEAVRRQPALQHDFAPSLNVSGTTPV